ncbi:MAG TPA: ribosome-recycling factor [Candidatus Absconditabacterales bacterium]|nr:ribosome-recycling factor [Candidatus Absconditabacterales bacterium]
MDLTPHRQQMDKALQFFMTELKALQVGRASAGLVENITVEASYGPMKVPQVAHVTIMDAQTIKIEPRDKNELKHVEKAIYDANAGLTPQNEGSYVIVKIPALTQERRVEITKQVKSMGEEIKGRVRLARQEAMKDNKTIFDAKEIGEDESKRNEKEIDALVKSMNEKIDELVKNKSDEIMTM